MTLLETEKPLKKTPLYDRHVSLGGKMVDFGGWNLPVYYTSILAEHQWTRSSCSFFDVSHLGEVRVTGPGAFEFLQKRLTNDMAKCAPGKIVYGILCDEDGFALDDILVYGASDKEYYLIVNASNIQTDLEELRKYAPEEVKIEDFSDEMACVAIQGPKAEPIVEKLYGFKLAGMPYYSHKEEKFEGQSVWVSRTGYTGEDGFEIFSQNSLAFAVWDRLANEGAELGARPAGLGARNTLRLEAGNILYGHELDRQTTPLEAGLRGSVVSFTKGDFTGSARLLAQKEAGLKKHLVGFKMLDRSIPREEYTILKDGRKIGRVTSGSFAPTVGCGIGMGFVEPGFQDEGTRLQIEIHGRTADAEVVKRPFVAFRHRNKG